MSALVLGAGAFVAVDRADRAMVARLRMAQQAGLELRSTGVVITQVCEAPPDGRRASPGSSSRPMSELSMSTLAEAGGVLLGIAGANDAVDASVVSATGDRRPATGDRRPHPD